MPNQYIRKGGNAVRQHVFDTMSRNHEKGEQKVGLFRGAVNGYDEHGNALPPTPTGHYIVEGFDFSGDDFKISWWNMRERIFKNCDFTNSIFYNCTMAKVKFVDCRLDGAQFILCDLYKSSFSRTPMFGAAFKGCHLERSTFDECDVSWAQFCHDFFGDEKDEQESKKGMVNVELASFADKDFKGRVWRVHVGSSEKRREESFGERKKRRA